jgi:ankyrin repeat protein
MHKDYPAMLDHGADVNNRMRQGWTPLHLAIRNGKVEGVRLLLQHDANVNNLGICFARRRYTMHRAAMKVASRSRASSLKLVLT